MIVLKALAVWLAILVAMVLTGGFRQAVLEPRLGELRGHQVGTLLACIVAFAVIYLALPWLGPSLPQAFALGAFWLALALAFEFGFFHFVAGKPWNELLADYDLSRGRLLILLWLTTLFGPPLAAWLRR